MKRVLCMTNSRGNYVVQVMTLSGSNHLSAFTLRWHYSSLHPVQGEGAERYEGSCL